MTAPEITLPERKHYCYAGMEIAIAKGGPHPSLPKGMRYFRSRNLPVGTIWKCDECSTYWIAGRPQNGYRRRGLFGVQLTWVSHVPKWRLMTRREIKRHLKGKKVEP